MKKKLLILIAALVAVAAAAVGCKTETITAYDAAFVTNGGTPVAGMTCSVIKEEPVSVRGGFDFAGWHLKEDLSDSPVSFPYTMKANTTFYAEWIEQAGAKTYAVTFEVNGGLSKDPISVSVIETEPEAERTGWNFKGWFLDENFSGSRLTFPYTVTADVTLYAKWEATAESEFTVTFETNGGTAVAERTYKYEEMIETEPVTTKRNGTFAGWYDNAAFSGERVVFPFEVIDDVTLYAKWTVDQTITPEEIAQLTGYLAQTDYTNYGLEYLWDVTNEDGSTMYKAVSYYSYANEGFYCAAPYFDDETQEWLLDGNGDYVYYGDYVFRRSETEYIGYFEDPQGTYLYNGKHYSTMSFVDPAEIFNVTAVAEIASFEANNFYPYDGKWYAKEDFADRYGQAVLGNNSDIGNSEEFTSFALVFDEAGKLTGIEAVSVMMAYAPGPAGSTQAYKYDCKYTLEVSSIGAIQFPTETDFLGDQERPTGLYPVLDENDPNRNVLIDTTKTYTAEQLTAALALMTDFKAYYTLAGNTFSGVIYETSTLLNDGNTGKVESGTYTSKSGGETFTATYENRYYHYDENTGAFFVARPTTSGGYNVLCDQYSYKNNYEYNHYLLGIGANGAISVNIKLPTIGLTRLDASKFTFDAEGHYFSYNDPKTIKAAGQMLFGDMDLVYPEAGETENYTYLRLYMGPDGKLAKVMAATSLELFGGSREFFMKELCVLNYDAQSVTVPAGISFIAPGEAKENGSVAALSGALTAMGDNYTYSDEFVYDYDDELVGVFGNSETGEYDVYRTIGSATQINNNMFYFYRDGEPYYCYADGTAAKRVYDERDPRVANSIIAWGLPITRMLKAEWFYEGKDGKFYAKTEHLPDVTAVIARYSGTQFFLGYPQVGGYTWNVVLEYCAIELNGNRIDNIYYSGGVRVKGSAGTHDKPFSGRGVFSALGVTNVTLPAGANADLTAPASVKRILVADYDFSVNGEGVLSLTPVPFATAYVANVYKQTAAGALELVKGDLSVTDGFDFKDAALGLITDDTSTFTYYLTITAKGGDERLDAPESKMIRFDLSRLNLLATPALTPDRLAKTVAISPVTGANGYHVTVEAGSDKTLVWEKDLAAGVLSVDLGELPAGQTYTVGVYAKGDGVTVRDGTKAECTVTIDPADGGTYLDRLFGAVDNTQSFYTDITGESRDALGNLNFKYGLYYFYDKELNKGRIIYLQTPREDTSVGKYGYGKNYAYPDVDHSVVFSFRIENGKLVGTTVTNKFGATVKTEQTTMDPLFTALKQLDQTGLVETGGYIDHYTGVGYTLADIGEGQTVLRAAVPIETFIGAELTYLSARLNVGFPNETLSDSACTLETTASDGAGNTVTMTVKFSGYGRSQSNWVK